MTPITSCSRRRWQGGGEAGIFKGRLTAIIDSSPVNGAGAVADTYELIRRFLRQAARAAGDRLTSAWPPGGGRSAGPSPISTGRTPRPAGSIWGSWWSWRPALVRAAADEEWRDPAVAEPAGLLAQVIAPRRRARPTDGPAIREGVAPDRVVSHSDPEMRHGRKSASRRFDGHKMDVITDEASELVLGVDVRAGNAGDGEGAAPLLVQVTGTEGIDVATLVGDMAYSDGDVREAVEAQGADLVAKVPPVTNAGRFPKTDFYIDLDAGQVTCPAGQTTSDARRAKDHKGRPGHLFRFDARTCATCPLREPLHRRQGGRTIFVGRHHRRIEAARAAQAQPATKALLRRRAKVERKMCATRRSGCIPGSAGRNSEGGSWV